MHSELGDLILKAHYDIERTVMKTKIMILESKSFEDDDKDK